MLKDVILAEEEVMVEGDPVAVEVSGFEDEWEGEEGVIWLDEDEIRDILFDPVLRDMLLFATGMRELRKMIEAGDVGEEEGEKWMEVYFEAMWSLLCTL